MKKLLALVLALTLAAALALPAAAEEKTMESEIRWLDFELPEELAEQLQTDQKAHANLFYVDFAQNEHRPVPGYYQLNYVESPGLLSVEQVRTGGESRVFDVETGDLTDYTRAYPLSGDLAVFNAGGTQRFGLMNGRGEVLIEPVCSAPVSLGSGMYGMVSASEKEAYLVSAGEGLAGTFPFENSFAFSGQFYSAEGEAWFCPVRLDTAVGLIDAKGEVCIPFGQYQDLSAPQDGLVVAIDMNGRYGALDTAGQTVIGFRYDRITNVSEGLAVVEADGRVGVMDTNGNKVIPLGNAFGYIGAFHHDLAEASKGDLWGVIDTTGGTVVPLKYAGAYPDWTGKTISVLDQAGKMGLLDTEGRELLPMEYDEIRSLGSGLFQVSQGDKRAVVDETGAYVLEPVQADSIGVLEDVFVVYTKNRQITTGDDQLPTSVLDSRGKTLLDLGDMDGRYFDDANEVFLVMEEGKYGLYSLHGGELLPLRYDAITPRDTDGDGIIDIYLVAEGRRVGLLDPSAAKKYDAVGGRTPAPAPFPWIWVGVGAGGAVAAIAVVVIAVVVSGRKKRAKAAVPLVTRIPPAEGPRFCTECGAPVAPGSSFCRKCGKKI